MARSVTTGAHECNIPWSALVADADGQAIARRIFTANTLELADPGLPVARATGRPTGVPEQDRLTGAR